MTPIIIALTFAVLATLYWAAKPNTTNHAEQDEKAVSRGNVTYDTKETK